MRVPAKMPARAAMEMSGDAMLVRGTLNRVVVSVRTRLRVGLRKGDHAGEHEKGRDEFLLHHHSYCFVVFGNPSPGRDAPIGGPIGRENDLRRGSRGAFRDALKRARKRKIQTWMSAEAKHSPPRNGMQPLLRCHPGRAN